MSDLHRDVNMLDHERILKEQDERIRQQQAEFERVTKQLNAAHEMLKKMEKLGLRANRNSSSRRRKRTTSKKSSRRASQEHQNLFAQSMPSNSDHSQQRQF